MRALCSNDNKCFLPAEVPYMEVAGDGEEFCKNFLAFFDAESGKCRLMREKESCSRFSLVCGVGLTCDFQECRNTTIAGEGERCDVPFQGVTFACFFNLSLALSLARCFNCFNCAFCLFVVRCLSVVVSALLIVPFVCLIILSNGVSR